MLVVVDANQLFSLLIRGSKDSEYIFFSNKVELIAPEFLLIEFEKYQSDILDKTHRTTIEFSMLRSIARRRIRFIPEEEFKDLLNKAVATLKEDPKDAPYLALAIKYEAVIWSEDRQLKKRSTAEVLNTAELMKKIG